MDYIFNSEKIENILSDFYISTGIAVTFYDSSMNMVATSPVYSDYCKYIRQNKECVKNCHLSNFAHMKEALKSKSAISYTCHAGLMETIMPIFYEETLIGYMQIGQFRDEGGTFSTEQKAMARIDAYSFDKDIALSFYKNLPVVSKEKMNALKKILIVLIKNFWDDSLIRHNRSMLSIKIEQYILDHIKEKLSVKSICEHFFLSKNALYRLFNSEFGLTIGDYILNKRIQLSIDALKNTTYPITRVAADCGFSDYNYFIRAFKKHVGVTPLQFRKNK